jgi:hypothetical protein
MKMEELAVTITRDAQGQYTVETENKQEQMAEGGEGAMEGMEEGMGAGVQKARDLNDALKIAKGLLEGGENASAESLFAKGFGGEEGGMGMGGAPAQQAPMGKPTRPAMM